MRNEKWVAARPTLYCSLEFQEPLPSSGQQELSHDARVTLQARYLGWIFAGILESFFAAVVKISTNRCWYRPMVAKRSRHANDLIANKRWNVCYWVKGGSQPGLAQKLRIIQSTGGTQVWPFFIECWVPHQIVPFWQKKWSLLGRQLHVQIAIIF